MDACPGRLNQVALRVNRPGTFYGQCSELCGINHSFMPIAVDVVTPEQYNRWLDTVSGYAALSLSTLKKARQWVRANRKPLCFWSALALITPLYYSYALCAALTATYTHAVGLANIGYLTLLTVYFRLFMKEDLSYYRNARHFLITYVILYLMVVYFGPEDPNTLCDLNLMEATQTAGSAVSAPARPPATICSPLFLIMM
jgi:hypothetical protein